MDQSSMLHRDLLAVTACKLVHSRRRAVTSSMTNFVAVHALDLNPIGIFHSLLGASTSGMSKF